MRFRFQLTSKLEKNMIKIHNFCWVRVVCVNERSNRKMHKKNRNYCAALIVKTTLIQSRASLYVETCQTGIGVVCYLSVSLLKVVFALEKWQRFLLLYPIVNKIHVKKRGKARGFQNSCVKETKHIFSVKTFTKQFHAPSNHSKQSP